MRSRQVSARKRAAKCKDSAGRRRDLFFSSRCHRGESNIRFLCRRWQIVPNGHSCHYHSIGRSNCVSPIRMAEAGATFLQMEASDGIVLRASPFLVHRNQHSLAKWSQYILRTSALPATINQCGYCISVITLVQFIGQVFDFRRKPSGIPSL
jgi:hypothetical protein